MFLIKENELIESAHALFQLLINIQKIAIKLICNCKFFDAFEGKKYNNNESNDDGPEVFLTEFLTILNYLFESDFVEKNFYNNYELTIILAEHFCHLKDKPNNVFFFNNFINFKKKK